MAGNLLRHIYRPNRGIVTASDSLSDHDVSRLKTYAEAIEKER
jgi:hypothetical protein